MVTCDAAFSRFFDNDEVTPGECGNRPSFTPAALPDSGEKLLDYLVAKAELTHAMVETGQFGADMKVSLVNDGPVTFWLRVATPDR